MSKTINQALADLVTGLGESSTILSDNKTVSDYIADVETAIKDYAGKTAEDLIDDTEASESKTYSSSKIASLIPADELPAVTSDDNGKVLGVSGGAWGAVEKCIIIKGSIASDTFTVDSSSEWYDKSNIDVRNALITSKIPVFVVAQIDPNTMCTFTARMSFADSGIVFESVTRNVDNNATVYKRMKVQTPPKALLSAWSLAVTTVTVNDPATT